MAAYMLRCLDVHVLLNKLTQKNYFVNWLLLLLPAVLFLRHTTIFYYFSIKYLYVDANEAVGHGTSVAKYHFYAAAVAAAKNEIRCLSIFKQIKHERERVREDGI